MAQFGIIRMEKFKKDAITGIQKHNQREGKESKNKDIDSERTSLNYDLVNEEKIKYHEEIKRMTDGRVKRKIRADAVLVSEFFISASPEYMNAMPEGEQKKYFQSAYEHIAEKYGKQNILYATVHHDESTPHMHIGVVPITDDGRLAAKDYFHGKAKIRAIQDDFHAYMNKRGFKIERGQPSELQHKSVHQFKKEERQKELDQLEKQLVHKEKEIQRMDTLREIKEEGPVKLRSDQCIEDLCSTSLNIETSKTAFGGKVKVEQGDFDKLLDLMKELQITLAAEHQRTHALSQEIDRNKKENKDLKEQLEDTKQDLSIYVSQQNGEVEKAKKQMREKLIRDFSEEQKEKVREEVTEEIKGQYEAHISRLSDDLQKERQNHNETKNLLKEENKKADKITKIAVDMMKSHVPKEKLDEAVEKGKTLSERVVQLEKENKELHHWKDRMVNWARTNLNKARKLAESFFKHAGMPREAQKYKDNELER